MDLLREEDIDPAPLAGKRIAIVGFGNQGRAQALNLKDSGIEVVVGLRGNSASKFEAQAAGLATDLLDRAVASAEVVMLLIPDEVIGDVYREIEHCLSEGSALGFSHGLAIHFKVVEPRSDLDIFLIAPKGPGSALRSLYQQGEGMYALWSVAHDRSGNARDIALAYGRAIGCARAGLIASSFGEECESDLFNEHAVVWGPIPEIMAMGFDVLVEAGISPEVAYLECVGELKLLAGLIEQRGPAGMREAISNAAELGAFLGGPRLIDESVREKMRKILGEIRAGHFAEELKREEASGYARLEHARTQARSSLMQETFRRLSAPNE
ncbi:MAG TPA: ketol-acid reductoisomerase [Sphingomicrobium sp.]